MAYWAERCDGNEGKAEQEQCVARIRNISMEPLATIPDEACLQAVRTTRHSRNRQILVQTKGRLNKRVILNAHVVRRGQYTRVSQLCPTWSSSSIPHTCTRMIEGLILNASTSAGNDVTAQLRLNNTIDQRAEGIVRPTEMQVTTTCAQGHGLNVKVHHRDGCAAEGWLCLRRADDDAPRVIKSRVDVHGNARGVREGHATCSAVIPDYKGWSGESRIGKEHSSQGDCRQVFEHVVFHIFCLSIVFGEHVCSLRANIWLNRGMDV